MQTARARIAVLLSLLLLAGACLAAVAPLKSPLGLAIDSTGKLYVANYGGNDILVYNLSYVQIAAKRITANVSYPIAVAFDPAGNLHVANIGANNITEYSSTGAAVPAGTTTNGVNSPQFIAVDELGNLWVNNGTTSVNVYAQTGELETTIVPFTGSYMYGFAVDQGWTVIGTDASCAVVETLPLLFGRPAGTLYSGSGLSVATDHLGNFYRVDFDGTVHFTNTSISYELINLGFYGYGIAVDHSHGRLYVSNPGANQIVVYDLNGNFLHTIE